MRPTEIWTTRTLAIKRPQKFGIGLPAKPYTPVARASAQKPAARKNRCDQKVDRSPSIQTGHIRRSGRVVGRRGVRRLALLQEIGRLPVSGYGAEWRRACLH